MTTRVTFVPNDSETEEALAYFDKQFQSATGWVPAYMEAGKGSACKGVAMLAEREAQIEERPRWFHRFQISKNVWIAQDFGAHRSLSEWLGDLLDYVFPGEVDEHNIYEVGDRDEDIRNRWELTVSGTERVLRFVCVLLNQHAEQHPQDATPATEAERLEATLAGVPNAGVACPHCHERDAGWKVDGDIRTRSAIIVGAEKPVVHVDLVDRDSQAIELIGSIECRNCAYELDRQRDAAIYEAVMQLAAEALGPGETTWHLLDDYRQF